MIDVHDRVQPATGRWEYVLRGARRLRLVYGRVFHSNRVRMSGLPTVIRTRVHTNIGLTGGVEMRVSMTSHKSAYCRNGAQSSIDHPRTGCLCEGEPGTLHFVCKGTWRARILVTPKRTRRVSFLVLLSSLFLDHISANRYWRVALPR